MTVVRSGRGCIPAELQNHAEVESNMRKSLLVSENERESNMTASL